MKIKISQKFFDSLNDIEGLFLMQYACTEGVHSCKKVINLARKHKIKDVLRIEKAQIFSIGGVYSVKMKDCTDVLLIRLSSGMIGDKDKIYLNNKLIATK